MLEAGGDHGNEPFLTPPVSPQCNPMDTGINVDWSPTDPQTSQCPSHFNTLGDLKLMCIKILKSGVIPDNFMSIITDSCLASDDFYQSLVVADAATFWNSTNKRFSQSWDLETIRTVQRCIDDWERKTGIDGTISQSSSGCTGITQSLCSQLDLTKESGTKTKVSLKTIMDNIPSVICQWEYYRIHKILPMPGLTSNDLVGFIGKVLPYLIQQVKMRGCGAIHASRINALVRSTSSGLAVSQRKKQIQPKTLRCRTCCSHKE